MKTPRFRPDIATEVVEQAAAWFVEFRAGDVDAQARAAFDGWLRRSPEHVQAYLEVARTYAAFEGAAPVDVGVLMARAHGDNVVALGAPAAGRAGAGAALPVRRRRGRVAGWAAAVVVLLGVGGAVTTWQSQRGIYATEVGEQRSVALEDGSTVHLNARSRVRVRYGATARQVELLAGQALFDVARDAARPFTVDSEQVRVRAVGTRFDVNRRNGTTTVTVLEGRVEVRSSRDVRGVAAGRRHPGPLRPTGAETPVETLADVAAIPLVRGERLTIAASGPAAQPTRADPEMAIAWTRRQLAFDGASLAAVAEEFNRYNHRRIVIEETEPGGFRISGVYASTDPASLLRFLRTQPGITVSEGESEIRIVRR